MRLVEAELKHAPLFFEHMVRHFAESGKEGDLIFHPCPEFESWNRETFIEDLSKRWSTPPPEAGWEKSWLVMEGEKIVGAATLKGSRPASSSHRCILGIGLERAARSQGFGRALTAACVGWAGQQNFLNWIDLYVFRENKSARALYESIGFKFVGETKDLFRVNGVSIDDIHMCLSLK